MKRAVLATVLLCIAGPLTAQTLVPADQAPVTADGPSAVQTLKPEDAQEPAGPSPSFQRGSGTRAGGPANGLNTGDRRASETLPGGDVADAVSGKDLYHGNYCGKGDRGPDLEPIDALDAVCRTHDQCYDRAGRPSCACDEELRKGALAVAEIKTLSREARSRAASVAEAATGMQCTKP